MAALALENGPTEVGVQTVLVLLPMNSFEVAAGAEVGAEVGIEVGAQVGTGVGVEAEVEFGPEVGAEAGVLVDSV